MPESILRLQRRRVLARSRARALTESRENVVASTELVATDDEHDPEGATIAFEREQISALIAAAEADVRTLDAALERAAEGTYGLCQTCGNEIAAGRLLARPGATTCIDCARSR